MKDKKITIYGKTIVKDSEGFGTAQYTPIHPGKLWAYVRQLSAKEYFASSATHQTEEMLFVVGWRQDVDTNCCISYKGVFYDITRVDIFEGYREDLKVYAGTLATQPKPEGVFEYYGRCIVQPK